jgi:hypothetical protein
MTTNRYKYSNSQKRDNSTVEGVDLHMVRPKFTTRRELTDRRQNTTEHRRRSRKTEVFSLFGVIIVRSYEVL